MKLTLTITLTEHEARALWSHVTEDDVSPPLGQDLALWAADYAMTTLESTWQFDAGVHADVTAGGLSDTVSLLQDVLATPLSDPEARESLIEALCAGHHRADDETAMAELFTAYAGHLTRHDGGAPE